MVGFGASQAPRTNKFVKIDCKSGAKDEILSEYCPLH
jgi:hypothetical protein